MCDTPPIQDVVVYTDGGCRPNPGKGAWAFILMSEGKTLERSGSILNTTNIRMEITAVIKAIEFFPRPCNILLYTDSQYVCNAITNKAAWLRKKTLLNRDLVLKLYDVLAPHTVQVTWVRGHAGDKYNERCDQLVNEAFCKDIEID